MRPRTIGPARLPIEWDGGVLANDLEGKHEVQLYRARRNARSYSAGSLSGMP